jgi:hypothetical protein
MQEQSSENINWMDEITPKTATLKVLDGQLARFVFQDEGKKKESIDYGTSVAFLVKVDGETEDKTFYVKANNFDLLGQIKELAIANGRKLTGLRAEVSRKGAKKSDTRYKIVKI